MNKSTIATNLIKARKDNKLTQDQAAKLMEIPRSRLGSWEEGRANPGIDMLKTICRAYGILDVMGFIYDKNFDIKKPVKEFENY